MSTQTHELLTKTQVIREYHYPAMQLDADLKSGRIACFTSGDYPGRYYIPRYAVEARIRELSAGTGAQS